MINTSAIWQHAAYIYHLPTIISQLLNNSHTIYLFLNASLQKMLGAFWGGGKTEEWPLDHQQKKGLDRARGLGRKAREATRKGTQVTARRQRHQTSLASLLGTDTRSTSHVIYYIYIERSLSIKKMNRTMLLYTALIEWTENVISSLSNLPCQRQHGQNWSLGFTPV